MRLTYIFNLNCVQVQQLHYELWSNLHLKCVYHYSDSLGMWKPTHAIQCVTNSDLHVYVLHNIRNPTFLDFFYRDHKYSQNNFCVKLQLLLYVLTSLHLLYRNTVACKLINVRAFMFSIRVTRHCNMKT